jgi:predicted TIM-barrel fold metal-dependent hydrolase
VIVKLEDLIIVSVDDHVIEPRGMFEKHMPAAFRGKGPRNEEFPDGSHRWIYEDRVVAQLGLNAVVGRIPEEYGCEPNSYNQMRKGTWDLKARIDDMNINGILGSICFGSFVYFDGGFFLGAKDKVLTNAVIQAYNDWHIDEWCGGAPGRFIPLAILPLWDVNLCVAEVKRVVKKGCHTISFPDNPAKKGGLPSIHDEYWEPLWKVCAENKVVISTHIGTGSEPPFASDLSPISAWITSMPMAIANSAADWIYLSALQRYPDLKISLAEGGAGWIPYLLERADFTHHHHGKWTNVDLGGKLPSEVFREHFLTCFIDDKFGVAVRDWIGTDIMMYECDYPHSDCVWPRSPEVLFEGLQDISDEDINKITHLNAMREFSYDPFSILGRENCTVGALRAQAKHVDTSLRSYGGGRPIAEGDKRRVTSGDVQRMFAANQGSTVDETV